MSHLRLSSGSSRRVDWLPLSLVVLVLVSGAVDLWWLHAFRAGYPLDIDESRYLAFGLSLRDGLTGGGPAEMWQIWRAQHDFGPLLPMMSVPVYLVFGRSVVAGLAAQLIFYALLIAGSYGVGARLTSRAGGVLAAVVVAGVPAVIDFSRSYQFALTDAAVLAAATWALLASEGFTRRGRSLVWGLLLGLMPLARTMAIAFVPAQLIAAGWLIVLPRGPRRPRLLNLVLGLTAGAAIAATWLAESLHSVVGYLTNFGYGTQSSHFSQSGSRLSVGYWTREAANAVRQDLYLPLAVLLALCLLVALVGALRHRPHSFAISLRRWAGSEPAIVCFILLEGYVAISSSRNEGVGFRVPLIALLVALVVSVLFAIPWRIPQRLLIACLVLVAAFNVLMKADVVGGLSGSHSVNVAGLGSVPVLEGRGYIQGYVLGSLEARPGSATQPLPVTQREWLPAYKRVVGEIFRSARRAGFSPNVELATDEPLLNANDFAFAARLHYRRELSVGLLPGPPGPASVAAYQRTLTGIRPQPNVVVTVSQVGLSYFALGGLRDVNQGLLERAAAVLGVTCGAGIPLPDGRTAIVSWRMKRSAPVLPPRSCVPRVNETNPPAGAMGVSTEAPVSVLFSLPVETVSLAHGFTLTSTRTGKAVPGRIIPFGEAAIVFRPSHRMSPHTRFTARLNKRVRAATGYRLPAVVRWSFVTRG